MSRVIAAVCVIVAGFAASSVLRGGLPGMTAAESMPFELTPVTTAEPPPWRLERVGGGHLALSDLRGSVTILYFWASW